MERKLRKVVGRKAIAGVCAGVAYWLGLPTWVVRLVWSAAAIFYGFGALLYLLLWIFMPKWEEVPLDYDRVTGG